MVICGRCNRAYRYSPVEVAYALSVSRQAVHWWMQRGWLRYAEPEPGKYRIRAKAVKRMLMDHPELQVRTLWRQYLREIHERQEAYHCGSGVNVRTG